jgi:glucokinase
MTLSGPLPHPLLVADIGGTNARFAFVPEPGAPLSPVVRRASGSHADFTAMVRDAVTAGGFGVPRSFLAAVAGPVRGRSAELTNAATTSGKLVLDGPALAAALGLEQGLLFNDFEALSLAAPFLRENELMPLGGGTGLEGGARLVVGPGTGLGVGALLQAGGRLLAVPSEGGHTGLGPETAAERTLWPHLGPHRLSAEDLISGRGLVRLYTGICAMRGTAPGLADPAAVTAAAVAEHDALAREAAFLFLGLLGRFAGDMALAFCAAGGVFIGGGMTPRLRSLIAASPFRTMFESKGPLSDYVRAIPTRLILPDAAALTGLAAVAAAPQQFQLAYAERFWRRP